MTKTAPRLPAPPDGKANATAASERSIALAAFAAPAAVTLALPARAAGHWPWVAAALLAAGAVLILRRPPRRNDAPIAGAGGTFLGAMLLAWAFSLGAPLGLESMTKLALAATLAHVAWAHGAAARRADFEKILFAVAGFYCLSALVSTIIPNAAGIVKNPQYRALWIALAAVSAAGRFFDGANRRRAAVGAAGVVFLAVLLILKSRAGLLSAAVGIGVLLHRRRGARGLAVGASLLAAGALGLWALDGQALFKTSDVFGWTRPSIWRSALGAIAERPFFGWGPGLFAWAYGAHRRPIDVDGVYFDHTHSFAHNDFLQTGVEGGLLALGALVLFLVGHFRRAATRPGPDAAWLAAGAAFCCVNFPFYAPGNALLAGALLAVTASSRPDGKPAPRAAGVFFAALPLALAAANLYSFWALRRPSWEGPVISRGQVEQRLGRADERMHRPGAGPEDFDAARRDLERIRAALPLPAAARDLAHLLTDHLSPPQWNEAAPLLDAALSVTRTDALWWMEKALCEIQRGRFAEAERAVDRARALEPNFGAAALLKIRLMIARGAADGALRLLDPLLKSPAAPVAVSGYAQAIRAVDRDAARRDRVAALARAGRRDEARRALDEIYPRGAKDRRRLEALILDGEGK